MQIFVAGATGRLGARVVRELLAAGFKVRAGARDVEAAQKAVDVAEAYGLLSARQLQQLEIVEVDITQPDTLRQAIGNASKVGHLLDGQATMAWAMMMGGG
ncbi:MAG: NmrA family NAD(P)-binding protein [Agrobacterium sp.]|uniref:NmrA family NAD(P)-binding protein n=1 Tax=Agrobacterium sp. TaxID=361 RepID=UPI0040345C58